MLKESRILNFLDDEQGYSVVFLEAQKLIHDLALIHDIRGESFSFFRDFVLGSTTLHKYIKHGEGLGFFIDSANPTVSLKMEINFLGYMRTLLMPEELQEIPQRITGICRLAKVLPNSSTPYTSIINLEDLPATDVVNYILKESYQVDSQIFLSDESDQAIMITKLPRKNYKKEEAVKRPSLGEYWLKNKKNFNSIFSKALNEDTEIVEEMKSLNLEYIGGTDIKFKCSCSLDRMINGVRSLSAGDIDAVFEEDKEIETKCDYCKSVYKITKEML